MALKRLSEKSKSTLVSSSSRFMKPRAGWMLWETATQRAMKGFSGESVVLSVATPLCPFGIAYRRAYGGFT